MSIFKQMKNKVKNNHGVSILFALFLFLVATMVTVTIINASLTSVIRVNDSRDYQQASLDLSSAEGIIVDQINGAWITVTKQTEQQESTTHSESAFCEELTYLVSEIRKLDLELSDQSVSTTFTMSIANMDDVQGTMYLKYEKPTSQSEGEYSLVILLSVDDLANMNVHFTSTFSEQTSSWKEGSKTITKVIDTYSFADGKASGSKVVTS